MFNKLVSLFGFFTIGMSQDICRSDTNNDNLVDVGDILNILSAFSSSDIQADINDDSIVDVNDLLLVLTDFGQTCETCSCCPLGAQCFAPDPPCCQRVECIRGSDCGGQLWTDCGTSCPLICGQPEPMMCNMMCNSEYQCPPDQWWDDTVKSCVVTTECGGNTLPPGLAIGRPFIDIKVIKSRAIEELNDWSYDLIVD